MTITDRSGGVASAGNPTMTDRRTGIMAGIAIKAPCRAASTAALTLSGEQTVDGVACVTGDRVLVKDQSTTSQNGIYVVSTGLWTRATDFDSVDEIARGTAVIAASEGTANGNKIWFMASADPTTIDSSAITFARAAIPPPSGATTDNAVARFDGVAGNIQNSSATIDDSGTLTIAPTAATTSKGFDVTQTGPATGSSVATAVDFNKILVNGYQLGVSGSGTAYALDVGFGFGGSNMTGQAVAIRGLAVLNSASSASNPLGNAYAGVSGEGQVSSGDAGTNTSSGAKGTLDGMYASAIAAASATNLHRITGLEVNTSLRATSSSRYNSGILVAQWNDNAVSASELDAGIWLGNMSGATGWKFYGIVFDANSAGLGTMFQSTATIIGTKGSMTVTNGIDISSATISGNAWASPNSVFITGAGSVGIGVAPNFKLHALEATAGTTCTVTTDHTDNTNPASHARFAARVGGASGGDPFILFTGVSGTSAWSAGMDNSDSDKFKISNNATLGSSDFLVIDTTTGNVSFVGNEAILTGTAIPAGGTAGAGYKFSSTANFGVFFGSGAPTLSAAKGSLYLRSDGSGTGDRMYVNTNGTTGWTNVTTAA